MSGTVHSQAQSSDSDSEEMAIPIVSDANAFVTLEGRKPIRIEDESGVSEGNQNVPENSCQDAQQLCEDGISLDQALKIKNPTLTLVVTPSPQENDFQPGRAAPTTPRKSEGKWEENTTGTPRKNTRKQAEPKRSIEKKKKCQKQQYPKLTKEVITMLKNEGIVIGNQLHKLSPVKNTKLPNDIHGSGSMDRPPELQPCKYSNRAAYSGAQPTNTGAFDNAQDPDFGTNGFAPGPKHGACTYSQSSEYMAQYNQDQTHQTGEQSNTYQATQEIEQQNEEPLDLTMKPQDFSKKSVNVSPPTASCRETTSSELQGRTYWQEQNYRARDGLLSNNSDFDDGDSITSEVMDVDTVDDQKKKPRCGSFISKMGHLDITGGYRELSPMDEGRNMQNGALFQVPQQQNIIHRSNFTPEQLQALRALLQMTLNNASSHNKDTVTAVAEENDGNQSEKSSLPSIPVTVTASTPDEEDIKPELPLESPPRPSVNTDIPSTSAVAALPDLNNLGLTNESGALKESAISKGQNYVQRYLARKK